MDPYTLRLTLEERLVEYEPELRRRWRDPEWWDRERWQEFLPAAEWHRSLTKFRTQAITSGNHFVEVMQMRELEALDLRWRYEGYDFFEVPSLTAKHTREGVALIEKAFPMAEIERLRTAASRYRYRDGLPATPDLFVYRQDGAKVVPVRFVEVKHGKSEQVSNLQLLGLALIREILMADVEIVRFAEAGQSLRPRLYEREWPRGGYIPSL